MEEERHFQTNKVYHTSFFRKFLENLLHQHEHIKQYGQKRGMGYSFPITNVMYLVAHIILMKTNPNKLTKHNRGDMRNFCKSKQNI